MLGAAATLARRRARARRRAAADDDALEFLAARSGGDARTALSALELACETVGRPAGHARATPRTRCSAARSSTTRSGDQHYDLISAWIKATRGSDPDASLLYLAAMLEGGEDPRFIARRMVILASEDVGNADPRALEVAVAAAARGRARRAARVRAQPRPGGRVPGAGAEVERLVQGDRARARAGCARTACRIPPLPALRGLPRRGEAGPRAGLRVPARRAARASRSRS